MTLLALALIVIGWGLLRSAAAHSDPHRQERIDAGRAARRAAAEDRLGHSLDLRW
jgi:hypothetical protein